MDIMDINSFFFDLHQSLKENDYNCFRLENYNPLWRHYSVILFNKRKGCLVSVSGEARETDKGQKETTGKRKSVGMTRQGEHFF